jgi:hypothetical protein
MGNLLQLDKAADAVGKSEVTLRRLIKANRIPYEKQKTLTGFIYLVDPDSVRAYYQQRGGVPDGEVPVSSNSAFVTTANGSVRVAVAGESGSPSEYWQKRAEAYEEKYFHELTAHSETRQELGMWRGRAEQAQAMVLKLLPARQEFTVEAAQHEKAPKKPEKEKSEEKSSTFSTVMAYFLAFLIILAVVSYFLLSRQGN